ncbi:MAG: hypothetical protein A3K77_07595, partial [Euryarchaeota archaeon RBG_13_31_8]
VLTGAFDNNSIQPNGVDITVKKISEMTGDCFIGKDIKQLPLLTELKADINNIYSLKKHHCYDVEFNEFVHVPKDMCAFLIHRSTLNRMGAIITSGWFDSNFANYIGAAIRPLRNIKIEKGARIAQIIFFKADAAKQYNGSYQHTAYKKS